MTKARLLVPNCYNCKFVADKEMPVDPKELNDEGVIDPRNKEEMERDKKADLITLPGGSKKDVNSKKLCYNEQVKMNVTIRMCCAYWDNIGVKRPWIIKS